MYLRQALSPVKLMLKDLKLNLSGGLDVPLPGMAHVRQRFDVHRLESIQDAMSGQLARPEIAARIIPGSTIAIGVGSRGISNLEESVRALVSEIKERGGVPFIFPAMGSHGGATAEGQTKVLAGYGITEERVGAPVHASMETVLITKMADGTPLYMDRHAHEADGVVLINRVKPHTTVRGTIQSGIIKMMIIGMGKIDGATIMHGQHGMDRFDQVLPLAAEALMPHIPFLFGVALIEDAYDHTAKIEAILPENLVDRETDLQALSNTYMGRLYFDDIDVLVIDRIGKEISGNGFDPNIAGRNCRGVSGFDRPLVKRLVLLDLSDETHGNATGLGLADVITRRLFDRIDFASTYANVITSAYLDGAAVPIVMETPEDAVRLAIKTTIRVRPEDIRLVRIKDTLNIEEIYVSEAMMDEVHAHPNLEVMHEPEPMVW